MSNSGGPLHRFLSADTIIPNPAAPQSFNRYSYVLGNPLKYTDPTGHYAALEDNDYSLDDCLNNGGCIYPEGHERTGHIIVWDEAEKARRNQIDTIEQEIAFGIVDTWWKHVSHTEHGGTMGYGVGGDFGIPAVAGTLSIGIIYMDADGNVALFTMEPGFMGMTGFSTGIEAWIQITNAPNIQELFGNTDVFLGGSFAIGQGAGADIIAAGESASGGHQIFGVELKAVLLGVAGGIVPWPPIEIHGGMEGSTQPWKLFNIYDLLNLPRPSQR
ncbi:MAG: hypothetical protein ACOYZ7_19975 [Chloroflexota bacterium]